MLLRLLLFLRRLRGLVRLLRWPRRRARRSRRNLEARVGPHLTADTNLFGRRGAGAGRCAFGSALLTAGACGLHGWRIDEHQDVVTVGCGRLHEVSGVQDHDVLKTRFLELLA